MYRNITTLSVTGVWKYKQIFVCAVPVNADTNPFCIFIPGCSQQKTQ